MKTHIQNLLSLARLVVLGLLSILNLQLSAFAQSTAFTYQGRLNDNASPANGIYDLRFAIYDSLNVGSQQGSAVTNAAASVSNGLFTVTLDFGASFPGAARWLEIGVRTNGGGFAPLSPRQHITATPYAITAGNLSGTLPAAQLSGSLASAQLGGIYSGAVTLNNAANSFTGNGGGLTNLNASQLASGTVPDARLSANVSLLGSSIASAEITDGTIAAADVNAASFNTTFWRTAGNAGTTPGTHFLGTTDNQPLEFKVNGQRALRIEYATNDFYGSSPNIAGGFSGNIISNGYVGAVIGGGGSSSSPNVVNSHFATVVGGSGNTANGFAATAMGYGTTASYYSTAMGESTRASNYSTAMGSSTTASGAFSTAMGSTTTASGFFSTAIGSSTTASAYASTAMGYDTTANGDYSTAMGYNTTANGELSAAMGYRARANHTGAFVWADSQEADFASTGGNQFCIRASGGVRLNGDTPIHFGSTLSQKLNLYGTTFGLGIQSNIQYSRVGASAGFAWYAGGVHNDATYNSGGGTTLMKLDGTGLTINGTFVSASDRNVKENFAPVQPREVLEKVIALPLSSWNYKADTATRHVGPMAQDFYAAFNVGPDDKHIATVDADGVALAAIQGLNQKVDEQGAALKDKDAEIQELRQAVAELQESVRQITRRTQE